MIFAKLDVIVCVHDKFVAASDAARAYWFGALALLRMLDSADGVLPFASIGVVFGIGKEAGTERCEELEKLGLFARHSRGFEFLRYGEKNETKADIEARRKKAREKKARQRAGSSRASSPDPSPGTSPRLSPGDTTGDVPGDLLQSQSQSQSQKKEREEETTPPASRVAPSNEIPKIEGQAAETVIVSQLGNDAAEVRRTKSDLPPKLANPRRQGRTAVGTRIDPDWQPRPETISKFRSERFVDATRSIDPFRDHWLASTRDTALKLDWEAAFRTWVRDDIERGVLPKLGPLRTTEGLFTKIEADLCAPESQTEILEPDPDFDANLAAAMAPMRANAP